MNELALYTIYLIYGLAFFAIGMTISLRDLKLSRLSIVAALPALALFGYTHALHEWTELYIEWVGPNRDVSWHLQVESMRSVKLLLSYLALGWFAWKMLGLIRWRYLHWMRTITYAVMTTYLALLAISYQAMALEAFLPTANTLTRWIFGLGPAVVSGLALTAYARQQHWRSHRGARYFGYCGLALIAYGVATGIIPTDLGLWVPVLRASCALAVLYCLARALSIFDWEREEQIRQAQWQLVRADHHRAVGTLASGLASEIEQPLQRAMEKCDELEPELDMDSDGPYRLEQIRDELQRSREVCKELVTFSQHAQDDLQALPLDTLLNSALELLSHRLKPFIVLQDLEPGLTILGNEKQLKEVLVNVLSNAIDASEEVKRLEISAVLKEGEVQLEIRDYGPGLSGEGQNNATEPFYTTKQEHMGLGLTLCHQVLQQHGGQLSLENWHHGLAVHLNWPRHQPA
ncbi:sensor histidine kinase [Ferrimonas marina]|uniref:histidine kinase n=1 Tax=Ferrimonas marina TaxID=299255 RepID=A0A1M5X380_9GAMM|nr:ATP-binding protein [Ferrimonas marina]SHH93998.1 Histidine kinase-, DNA gyrase B-, and HSP90-like ATPase [Ferrimonas marina]